MANNEIYTSTVQEDENGDLFIELSESLLSQMGWTEETLLEWEVDEDTQTATLKESNT